MKTFKLLIAGLTTCALTVPLAQAEPTSKQVPIAINEAFVPGGFDSQTDAYVIASGIFPNGCYKWDNAQAEHNREENIHTVRAYATVSQGMCLMVLVPFTQEIGLGKLETGKHKIRFASGDGTYMEKEIAVE